MTPALNPETNFEPTLKKALIGPTGITLLVVSLVVAASAVAFESSFGDKILPGVVAANIPLGGLKLEAATQKLETALLKVAAPKLTVRAGTQSLVWNARELGWKPDARATAIRAQEIGRRGNTFKQIQDRLNALAGKIETPLQAKIDEATVRNEFSKLAKPFLVPAVNATIQLEAGRFTVTPDRIGQGLNLEPSIRAYKQTPSLTELNLKVVPVTAEHTGNEFIALAERANALLRPIKLTYIAPGSSSNPSTRVLTLLEVAKLFRIKNGSLEAAPENIQDRLERVANAFDQPARQARYVRYQGQLVVKPEARGWKLNLKTAQSLLAEEVLRADSSEVILPVIGDEPRVAAQTLSERVARVRFPGQTCIRAHLFSREEVLVSTSYSTVQIRR